MGTVHWSTGMKGPWTLSKMSLKSLEDYVMLWNYFQKLYEIKFKENNIYISVICLQPMYIMD